jgi:hypothetical protein
MYLLWQNEKTSHKLTKSEYKALVDKLEANKFENDKIEKIRAKKYSELENRYKETQQDRDDIKKGLENEINRVGSLLNSIRMLKNSSNNSGLPKNEISTELSTQVGRECNSTIAKLVEAGKSCANQYNTLYDAWLIQCDTFGCEN